MATVLFYVTAKSKVDSILMKWLRAGSYWSASERLTAYYAETVEDEGDEPVVLRISLEHLDEAFLRPDMPGIEEPITTAIGMKEAEVVEAWTKSARR